LKIEETLKTPKCINKETTSEVGHIINVLKLN